MYDLELKAAHKHSASHREEVIRSKECGCFYCLAIFRPQEITEWIDEKQEEEATALCPHCGIDAVLSSASGFPITEDFLGRMRAYWFHS